ncbi:MAG: PEP-CTERM sorting domain-containing protein [Planctomycetota bacterium]
MRSFIVGFTLVFLLATNSRADLVLFELDFDRPSVPVRFNGTNTPIGRHQIRFIVDTETPNVDANLISSIRTGTYATKSASITAPALNLDNVAFDAPSFLFTNAERGQIGLRFGSPTDITASLSITGLPRYMTNSLDLRSLIVPFQNSGGRTNLWTTGNRDLRLANGSLFNAGASGRFLAGSLSVTAVPEPSSLVLVAITVSGLSRIRRKRASR